jgi:hypothetical protein
MTSRTDPSQGQRCKGRGNRSPPSPSLGCSPSSGGLPQVARKSNVVRVAPPWRRLLGTRPLLSRWMGVRRPTNSARGPRRRGGCKRARTAAAGDLPARSLSSTRVLIRGSQAVKKKLWACSNGRMRGHHGCTGPQRHRSWSQVVDFFTPHQINHISSKIDICTIQCSPPQCKSISFAAIRS